MLGFTEIVVILVVVGAPLAALAWGIFALRRRLQARADAEAPR